MLIYLIDLIFLRIVLEICKIGLNSLSVFHSVLLQSFFGLMC